MDFKDNNNASFKVGVEEGENRYVTSFKERNENITSLAIVASILVLAIITCTFFAVFTEESFPVFNPDASSSTSGDPTSSVTKPIDPEKTYPYATQTDKTQFIADEGGKGMYAYDINSDYAILIKLSDMSTLGHKYADELIYPASMTKVMTIVTALDFIEDLDDGYIITQEVLSAVPKDASVAWLSSYVGRTVTVRDLLYGISYMSGADSVICLIDYLNLTVNEFVSLMNMKAEELDLTDTHFGGAIGMDTENNTTTCREIAAIMAYAMENPLCRELFGGLSYRLDYLELTYYNSTLSKTLVNLDTDPDRAVKGYTLLAAKSGLEDKAGYCLVSYLQNNETGEYFILVTAKADRAESSPYNQNTIHDMVEIFDVLKP